MSCTEDVASALQAIANALANNSFSVAGGCCTPPGSAGGGAFSPPPSTNEEGDPETDPPPDGYDSWEQFFAQKCAIANDILDRMIRDTGQYALINFGAITVETLTVALTTLLTLTISSAGIIAIATLLISVITEIIITTALSILNDNKEDLVCELFNGTSASDSINRFNTLFGSLVDTGVSDPIENFAIKQLIGYMLEPSEANKLYNRDTTRVFPESTCDCAECEPTEWDWLDNSDDLGFAVENSVNMDSIVTSGTPTDAYQTTSTNTASPGYYDWVVDLTSAPIEIFNGMHSLSRVVLGSTTTFYLRLYFASAPTSPVDVYGSGTAVGDNVWDVDLSAYAGEEIVKIGFYQAWGYGGAKDITYYYLQLTCE